MTFNYLHKRLYQNKYGLRFVLFLWACLFSFEVYGENGVLFRQQSLTVEGKPSCCIKNHYFSKQLSRKALKVLHDTGCWPLDAGCFLILLFEGSRIYSIQHPGPSIDPLGTTDSSTSMNWFHAIFMQRWGKIISVIPADLDGRGAADLVVVHKTGVYPEEERWISIFSGDGSAQYPKAAHQRLEADAAATLFDVGDVAPSPGKEIFYLTRHGVDYYGQDKTGQFSINRHH